MFQSFGLALKSYKDISIFPILPTILFTPQLIRLFFGQFFLENRVGRRISEIVLLAYFYIFENLKIFVSKEKAKNNINCIRKHFEPKRVRVSSILCGSCNFLIEFVDHSEIII